MTLKTMRAVPRMSSLATAGEAERAKERAGSKPSAFLAFQDHGQRLLDSRVPTSHFAKRKLKMSDVEPSGATHSDRKYLSESVEPTGREGSMSFDLNP